MKLLASIGGMRRLRTIPVLGGLWLATALGNAQDFQSWNEVDVVTTWKHGDLWAPLLVRTDPAKPNPQLAATGLVADLMLRWGLTLTSGYLFADLPQAGYKVHLPLVMMTEKVHLGRVVLADGNRFEKLFGYPKGPVRYRNLVLVDCTFGSSDRAHAFIGDEVFFDLSAGDYNQNRFQTGAGVHLNDRLLLDLYYLQKDPVGSMTIHALGTRLTVSLGHRTPDVAAKVSH
jgi:hypothetical protein